MNILRLSHVCLRATSLEKARYFYSDLLGLVETEQKGDMLYLRGTEEGQHHSLVIKQTDSPGLAYIAFRVKDIDRAKEELEQMNIKVIKFKEEGVDDAILFSDPQGIPIMFYNDMEYVGDVRLDFYKHRGASPVRLAHVNFMVKDIEGEFEFFRKLGFVETEEFLDKEGKRMVIWMTKNGQSHDIAIGRASTNVPGFHHLTYYVHDVKDIIRTADILASAKLWDSIERGPGRHGATEGYYIYVRDFDKNRIEFFTADYLVLDPDKWKVKVWSYEESRYRADFWGRPVPESWLKEWVPVEDPFTGKLRW